MTVWDFVPAWPSPSREMLWAGGLRLSVKTAELVSEPAVAGAKLRLKLQAAPEANDAVAMQSSSAPLVLACVKFAPTVSAIMFNGTLPLLPTVSN